MSSPQAPDPVPGSEPAIRLIEVAKSYGTDGTSVRALQGVSMEVRRGERLGLLGKSGSGKSTLLNLLGGLDRPSAGRVEVAGYDLARLSRNELARYRLTTVGMIFQSYNLVAARTALENVELPLVFAGGQPRARLAAARAALEQVGLGHRLGHQPAELSGGEQQRVAIARALVTEPRVLLADEPTGNLDSDAAVEVMELLTARVRERGVTLVLVTHDGELAGRYADRVVVLRDGQVCAGAGEEAQ